MEYVKCYTGWDSTRRRRRYPHAPPDQEKRRTVERGGPFRVFVAPRRKLGGFKQDRVLPNTEPPPQNAAGVLYWGE